LKLNIQDVDETGAGQTTVASSLTLSNMKPGDAVVAPIKLTKAGSIDTKYGIAYTTATAQPTDTNLANILHIQVLGTGTTGTGTNTATGANACNATNFAAPGTIWPDAVVADTALAAAGATLLSVSPTSGVGRNIPTSGANTGFEVLCVKVSWPDGGAPPSLTTGDNQYNLATAGVVNTTLSFAFDGLAQP
jgi:hypothetical protein